ncbi:TonB-dependent receptor family protein [Flavobacteriaceae bacterium F89]|uniref:TonB-dependent receptor family protein n=1 Tax=Cerina litoralis TaxID=2874477 RepID=A0AAE3EW31_9FLAO|nr:outer membrane beta-barrel family protein [Cerina litoralis]MCG2461963.1 TonB-dependent receptor family protein [Cerina litoralis]
MTRLILFLLMPFFWPLSLSGQSFKVTGTVKDGSNFAIPYANVFLVNLADSTIVKGTSADENGFFSMENVLPDIYYIRASYIGKTSNFVSLDIHEDVRIGALIIDQNVESLEEVVVVSSQPKIEKKSDRIVFHVENTVVSQGSSWDILKKTPGVVVVQDKLYIRNQSPTVYLNDRKTQLSPNEIRDLLQGISGINIKSIEVVPNPPARYESEDGPILNIVTSNNFVPGYKGSVNGTYTQSVFPKYSFGTSHYYKTKKFNLFANYNFNPREESKVDNGKINFIDDNGDIFSRWQSNFNKTTRSLSQNASIIADYELNDRNSINLTSNLAFTPHKKLENRLGTDMRNRQFQLDSTLFTVSNLENEHRNLAFDLTYTHHPKKEGSELTLNGHYTSFHDATNQTVSTDYFDPSGAFIRNFSFYTNSLQHIDILTGQIDYTSPLGGVAMETGAKMATIRSNSGIDYFDLKNSIKLYNALFSDNYEYSENVGAGYVSLSKDWNKWSAKAGLRGEYTHAIGYSITLDRENIQDYFKVFPTLHLLYTLSENQSFSLDYSHKIQRPKYEDLNPFAYFLNENQFYIGNPDLQPSFSHNVNFNYTLQDTYFFDVYYRDNGRIISALRFQDNQNQNLMILRQNVLGSISYGLDFTYSKSILDNWYLYAYTSLFSEEQTFLAIESNDQVVTNRVRGFYGSLSNYFTLSKDKSLTGELGLNYMSGFMDGNYKISETTDLSLGFRKSLWKKRAVVSLTLADILNTSVGRYTAKYLNQDNSYITQPETRYVRVGFTYNFGNFRLEDNKRDIENIEERQRLESD